MTSQKTTTDWLKLALIILIAIGIFFRFFNLDRKLFWMDETSASLRVSGFTRSELIQNLFTGKPVTIEELHLYQRPNDQRGIADTIRSLKLEDPKHPPLPYILTRFWSQTFGNGIGVRRALPALISVFALAAGYWLSVELFGSSLVGLMAMALIAISPLRLVYAQDAKQYSLLIFAILFSSAALLKAIRSNTRLSWAIYALSTSLGLYTHLFFTLVAFSQGVHALLWEKLRFTKTFRNYLIAATAAVLAFSPWMAVIAFNYSNSQTAAHLSKRLRIDELINIWVTNFSRNFLDIDLVYYKSLRFLGMPITVLNWAIAALGLASIYFVFKQGSKHARLFLFIVMGITGVSFMLLDVVLGGQRSTEARYLFPFYLAIQLSIAYFLTHQLVASSSQIQRRLWGVIFSGVAVLGVGSCWMFSQADVWWHQFGSYSTPPIARIINQAPQPVLVSDTISEHILSISHMLDPKVRLQVVRPPNVPEISSEFSDVFLFRASRQLREQLGQHYTLQPTESDKLWRIKL